MLQLLDTIGGSRQLLVGSSLGAWLALHAALRRPHLVRGLLLLAPAVDMPPHWRSVARPAGVDGAGHELVMLPSAYMPVRAGAPVLIRGCSGLPCGCLGDAGRRGGCPKLKRRSLLPPSFAGRPHSGAASAAGRRGHAPHAAGHGAAGGADLPGHDTAQVRACNACGGPAPSCCALIAFAWPRHAPHSQRSVPCSNVYPSPCSMRDDTVPLQLVHALSEELQRSSRAFHLEMLPVRVHAF